MQSFDNHVNKFHKNPTVPEKEAIRLAKGAFDPELPVYYKHGKTGLWTFYDEHGQQMPNGQTLTPGGYNLKTRSFVSTTAVERPRVVTPVNMITICFVDKQNFPQLKHFKPPKQEITFGPEATCDFQTLSDEITVSLWFHPVYQRYFLGVKGENTRFHIEGMPCEKDHFIMGNLQTFETSRVLSMLAGEEDDYRQKFRIEYDFLKDEEFENDSPLSDTRIRTCSDYAVFKTAKMVKDEVVSAQQTSTTATPEVAAVEAPVVSNAMDTDEEEEDKEEEEQNEDQEMASNHESEDADDADDHDNEEEHDYDQNWGASVDSDSDDDSISSEKEQESDN